MSQIDEERISTALKVLIGLIGAIASISKATHWARVRYDKYGEIDIMATVKAKYLFWMALAGLFALIGNDFLIAGLNKRQADSTQKLPDITIRFESFVIAQTKHNERMDSMMESFITFIQKKKK